MDYNHYRLHSSLGYMAPAYAAKFFEEGSAFLKAGRIRVKYSHNNWYKKQGQSTFMENPPIGLRIILQQAHSVL